MTGMIQGGWEFVYAAYGITGAAMALYGISLFVRLRKADHVQQGALPAAAIGADDQLGDGETTSEDNDV